jgi:transposase
MLEWRLLTELEQLKEENRILREQLAERDARIAILEQKLDAVVRRLFGTKSEKLDPGQLELLLGESLGKAEASGGDQLPGPEASETESGAAKPTPRNKPRRPRIPDHLPVVEEVIDPDCVKACPEAWRQIGEEVSEQLDYEPGRFLRRRLVRRKYVRRAGGAEENAPVIAPLPGKLVERGMAAPGLLAHIAVSKFADHLPLYRLEQIFGSRHGVDIPRQTMSRWMETVADWMMPLHRHTALSIFAASYVQVDETPVRYQDPGTGKTRLGYLWTFHVPGGQTLFEWRASRASACLAETVPADFRGILQCDAYGAYPAFAAIREGIVLAGCWAHARRGFHEALAFAGADAARVLALISGLYRIEGQLREERAGPEERLGARWELAVPLLEQIHRVLTEMERGRAHLPQSKMGKAIAYALRQWEMLLVYTKDGRVEIDNNLCENQIRPTAVGKKNWLFIGREDTGWRSAVLYTLLANCRANGVEPYSYLKGVLELLPRATNWQIESLTPAAWGAGQHLPVLHAVA